MRKGPAKVPPTSRQEGNRFNIVYILAQSTKAKINNPSAVERDQRRNLVKVPPVVSDTWRQLTSFEVKAKWPLFGGDGNSFDTEERAAPRS